MKKLLASILFVLIYFFLFVSSSHAQLSLPPKTSEPPYNAVDGQDAIPPPYKNCSAEEDPEFHSLRPYQASPCYQEVADTALICANTLLYDDTVKVPCTDDNCTYYCEGGVAVCTCVVNVIRQFYVNAFDAELPIMGNTEDEVVNSQFDTPPPDEGIDHYAKVNEYVSWYLNGVNQRAEYDPPDPNTEEGQKLITSFSGPIKKLLSYENLGSERNQQIERALKSGSSEFDEGGRHNEIITCKASGDAVSCYTTGGSIVRIKDNEKMPLMSDEQYDNNFDKYKKDFADWFEDNMPYYQYIPLSSTEDRKGDLHINNFYYTSFDGDIDSVENIGYPVNHPIYLYFSHMEETRELADQLQRTYLSVELMKDAEKGYHKIDTSLKKHVVKPEPPECDLTRVRTNPGDTLAPGDKDSPEDMIVDLNYTATLTCKVPASGGGGDVDPDCYDECMGEDCLSSEANCSAYCKILCGEGDCVPQGACEGTIDWEMPLDELMPLAYEDFERLVASPQSPFQKTFPLIHPGGYPLQGIWDMPGYSLVDYESELLSGNYLGSWSLADKKNPANLPDPLKLFYPHIGSIHQYFLNCIQTALRPQGYGPYCPRGEPCPCEHGDPYVDETPPVVTPDPNDPNVTQTPAPSSTLTPPPPPTGTGYPTPPPNDNDPCDDYVNPNDICNPECRENPIDYSEEEIQNLIDACEYYAFHTGIWADNAGNPREEECESVIRTSIENGVDPAFVIALWWHETGFSNYPILAELSEYIQDFGINVSGLATQIDSSGNIIEDNFYVQLSALFKFTEDVATERAEACGGLDGSCALELFMIQYACGLQCPDEATAGYFYHIIGMYEQLVPDKTFSCYPMVLP